jgi:hypothetical protein
MCQLNARHGALLFDEMKDARQHLDVRVLVDAKVLRADAAFGDYGAGLRNHQARAAYGSAAQMNKMPVVGEAIFGAVLAHGRNPNAVAKGNTAELERSK